MAHTCFPRTVLTLRLPNPSHIDTSRVVMLAVDTGPPPDTVLLNCPRRRYRRPPL